MLVPQARPASATLYIPVPYSTISPVNTSTWQLEDAIPAGGSGTFVLSPDGTTFYAAEFGSLYGPPTLGYILAIDRATGKTLRSYHTQYPIWGGLALLPDQSQIYVDTCSSSIRRRQFLPRRQRRSP
jgi:DNA-binding beta-propeller fold protein YncE